MKIICIGRNYANHAKELGNDLPEQPVIFIKPDTALLKGSDFYLPEFSDAIHYELEMVLKISKGGKYILKENAHRHYEEVALGLDFTARDLQSKLKSKGLPWELAKGFDGSACVSSFFPKAQYPPAHLNFSLFRNGKKVQDGHTENMIFSADEIIAFASQYFTLRVGDLLFTGTPEGVGKLEENDVLQAYIEDKKVLDIRVV